MKTSDKPKSNTQEKPKTADKPKAAAKPASAKDAREALIASARDKQAAQPDPLQMLEPKKLAVRIGIPLAIVWIIALFISGWISKVVALVVTIAVAGLVVWVVRYAKRSRAVANLVRGADTPEARKEAIEKLESEFGKDDPAAVFARAQLELQEDPKKALATLESIKLDRVMPPVADEARAQRAMIHLVLGETEAAKGLVDKIDLSRHKDAKSRATIAAIVGEAWARGGQAKKAVELLDTLDPNDATFADIKPQLLRSRAFAYAWTNDTKRMKQILRQLSAINPQYLASFITKKKIPGGVSPKGVHPLLEKEAFEMISKSGMIPRKMEYRRS
ncbi:tetratricopeptide repeat protein [Polyangium jinanense]|uniref:Uncharacterized protein n=1 Tax=Polyangium jinanense TaxID=2829994 RepID=A0A9X3X2Q1_9BACT|nr:hypothetical protein [Polyangium jinanense]MDC3955037.1 hypothetical protein [Polyangium jinanense]MDC3981193.1 hypothetical protein [Polyangium jinanense]